LRQLRRDNHSGSILILTAHDAEADRVRGLDLGADDYVTKPFSLPELEARVRALIRRSQAVKSPQLRFGRLTVDTVARRASIGSDLLDLTPREWAVLEYLLMRVGQVVSKDRSVYLATSLQAPGCRNQDSHRARIWLHGPGSGCKLASAGISPTG